MWNKPHVLNAIADLLFAAAAAALLVAGALWLLRVPALPIRHVVVKEELRHVRRGEIEQALSGVLRGNFFSVNLNAVRHSLEKLPWIRHVGVRRVWPAKLEISIEEHKPAARWGANRNELVNSFGEVFTAGLAEPEALVLPLIYGPNGTAPELIKRYREFVQTLAPIALKPVQVTLSERLAWQLKTADGMVIELGREQAKAPVSERLARFVAIYPSAVASRPQRPASIDLRYPNGFALRSKG